MDSETELLLDAYWNAAYQQGLEHREADDEKGTAQDAEWALVQHIKALRAQVFALQAYAGDEIYRSDFRTAADMRASLEEERRLHKHWRDQHANEVRRAKILKDTTDLPLERVRGYELMGELQGQVERLQAEVVKLRGWYNTAEQQLATSQRRDYEKGAESMRKRAAQAADDCHGEASTCGDIIAALPLKENEG